MHRVYIDMYTKMLPGDHVRVSRLGLASPTANLIQRVAKDVCARAAYTYAGLFKGIRAHAFATTGAGHKAGKANALEVFGTWLGSGLGDVLDDDDEEDDNDDDADALK